MACGVWVVGPFPTVLECFGCMSGSGIDHPRFQIDQTLHVQSDMKVHKHLIENAAITPVAKPLIHPGPGAEALRHVAPNSASAEHVVEHQAIIRSPASRDGEFQWTYQQPNRRLHREVHAAWSSWWPAING